jgi:anti-anti-sigma factor
MRPTPAHEHGSSDQGWCSVNTVDGCVVVTASGRFAANDYDRVRDALTIAGTFANRIVLDVTDVRSMEPTMFGMLIGHLLRMRKESVAICLVGPLTGVHQGVDATLLDNTFDSYSTVDDAVSALQEPPPAR